MLSCIIFYLKSVKFLFFVQYSIPLAPVVVVVVNNVQSSLLKLLGQSKANFMWSLLGKGE